jgi:hypothetical protein
MIASAMYDGNYTRVYDENGWEKFSKHGELVGYTGSTVTVKSGISIVTYDENGNVKFSKVEIYS